MNGIYEMILRAPDGRERRQLAIVPNDKVRQNYYDKALKHVMDHPEELTHRGNMATLHAWPDMTSHDYEFTFLGVKTDEGYSIEKWNEWKNNGEI